MTEEQPLVSVIIRTHGDRQELLAEAVASVVKQTYKKIELIIIEDGSSKNIAFSEFAKSKFYRFNYAPITKSGRCVAGNKGLALSTGKYINFLDDDDCFLPEHIETLVSTLKMHPYYMAAYSDAFEVATHIKSLSPLVYSQKFSKIIRAGSFSRPKMWLYNYLPIQSVLFDRKLYETYGGLDRDLEYLEDWNLWTWYTLNNDFIYVPKITSLYRVPATSSERERRQLLLESHRAVAENKQKTIGIHLSIADIKKYASEMAEINKISVWQYLKNIFKLFPLKKLLSRRSHRVNIDSA